MGFEGCNPPLVLVLLSLFPYPATPSHHGPYQTNCDPKINLSSFKSILSVIWSQRGKKESKKGGAPSVGSLDKGEAKI